MARAPTPSRGELEPRRVENKVDFSNPRNLITVAAALTAGAGDLTLKFGDFTMGGIGTATFGAIILYQILGWNPSNE